MTIYPTNYTISILPSMYPEDRGVSVDLSFICDYNDIPDLQKANWNEIFPGSVIVKCQHCGQWAARKTMCKTCGAPID
jgi:hypothetical protein